MRILRFRLAAVSMWAIVSLVGMGLLLPTAALTRCSIVDNPSSDIVTLQTQAYYEDTEVFTPSGPYIDNLVYEILPSSELMVQGLLREEIDIAGQYIDSDLLSVLHADPNIAFGETERRGFGALTMRCVGGPFGWQACRRALAHAIDKGPLQLMAFDGYSRPIDSPLPPSFGIWSVEHPVAPPRDDTDYEPEPVIGNALLDEAHYFDLDGDGYREDPTGEEITIEILGLVDNHVHSVVLQVVHEALASLALRSECVFLTVSQLFGRIYYGDFQCAFFGYDFSSPVALESLTTQGSRNYALWSNLTYDEMIDEMMTSIDFNTALNAAYRAQEIIIEDAPLIPLYCNLYPSARRTDKFDGYVTETGIGAFGQWTPRKVHLKEVYAGDPRYPDYPLGGAFHYGLPQDFTSLNPLTSVDSYSLTVLSQIYETLAGPRHPDTLEHMWTNGLGFVSGGLATDWEIEEIVDGLNITFHIHPHATWHDGTPLTAYDANFSYNLMNELDAPSCGESLQYFMSCNASDAYTFWIATNEKGFFIFDEICDWFILPQHIWKDLVNPINYGNYFPVGSGPFKWSSHVPGSQIVLGRNDNYHYGYYSTKPTITDASDVNLLEGSDVMLVWYAAAVNPGTYRITEDGDTAIQGELWTSGTAIEYSLNHLKEGTHVIVCYVFDDNGDYASDTVYAYVEENPRQLLLKLSGSFDYLLKEEIRLQLAGLLTDMYTGHPETGATITFEVYSPDGAILISGSLDEDSNPGVYVYTSQDTMKDLKMPKGIYLVYARATSFDGLEAVDMIQFHIDPPSGQEPNVLLALAISGFVGLLVLDSLIAGRWVWRKQRLHTSGIGLELVLPNIDSPKEWI